MYQGVFIIEELLFVTEKINGIVWGAPTITVLVFTGILFSVKLRFFQITKAGLWLRKTLFALFKKSEIKACDKKSISQLQAVSAALAGTIGTGNIAGVATAISAGGPGAVFWMWISAIFSMMTSYAENALGIFYRRKKAGGEWCGGPMYYMEYGLKKSKKIKGLAKPLACLYAFFLILASFGIGNMTQANSVSASMKDTFCVPAYVSGALLAVLSFLVISGGIKRIGSLTEKLVPFMALFYISASFVILISNYKAIPYVLSSIFQGAFSFRCALGAAGGLAVKKCISTGFKRGVFSNEAGLGASVMINSCSSVSEPAVQGMWGIFQVFADTVVVCTMTAFVLLSTGIEALPINEALDNISEKVQYVYIGDGTAKGTVMLTDTNQNEVLKASRDTYGSSPQISGANKYTYTNIMALRGIYDADKKLTDISLEEVDGVSLITLAFSKCFGKTAAGILSCAIVLFAFSTIVGWSFYGMSSFEYLFGKKSGTVYKTLFICLTFIGAITELSAVWGISDIFNALMAVPNLIALLLLSNTVSDITENYLKRKKGEKIEPMLSDDAEIAFEAQVGL